MIACEPRPSSSRRRENAHTEEQTEAIEFSDTTNEAQIEEAQTDRAPQDEIHEINDTQGPAGSPAFLGPTWSGPGRPAGRKTDEIS